MVDSDLDGDICLSGGADGADLMWGTVAHQAGHRVIHFSFANHKTQAPPDERTILTAKALASADPYCHQANKTLRRQFPAKSQYVSNLVRRNWFQVEFADSCYAISTFSIPIGRTIPLGTIINAQIDGGTAWAVEMFKNRHNRQSSPCYMFDQELAQWFEWSDSGWGCIYEPPRPRRIWAGIGSRRLNRNGKLAIRVLMDYQMDYHSEEVQQKYASRRLT